MTKSAEELRAVPNLEQQYFARGKELLGPKSGGLLVTLLRKKGGDLALARAVLELAATKQDPREYVSRVAGPKNPGRLSVAQIDGLKAAADRQLAERERLSKPHSEEDKARVFMAHAKFKGEVLAAQKQRDVIDRALKMGHAIELGEQADALMRRAMDEFDREFGG